MLNEIIITLKSVRATFENAFILLLHLEWDCKACFIVFMALNELFLLPKKKLLSGSSYIKRCALV